MKAIICRKYGSPKDVELDEVEKPVPSEHEVLVKVYAAAVNDYDWSVVRGKPYIYRLFFGFRKPKNPIPGMELAGKIEAIGSKVENFKSGDAVYGDISEHGFGSFAEYICINEKALVLKPDKMTYEEASSLSHASMLAVQGLIDVGDIKEDQKILINGAGGGMGTFALQIAKKFNAKVTGVDSGDKLEMMKSNGFDFVIDYKKEDFTRNSQTFDLILDAKTTRPPLAYLRSLKPQGKYVTVGGYLNRLFQIVLMKRFVSMFTKKSIHVVALKSNKDLPYIHKLFEERKIKPEIDGPYDLAEVPRLIQYFGEGKHKGKIVISIFQDQT